MSKFYFTGPLPVVRASLSLIALAWLTAGVLAADTPKKVRIGNSERVFPESMTAKSDGTLYAGSTMQGIVYKADAGADKAEPWTEKQDGPQNILGVYADEDSDTLWVCYSDFASRRGSGGQDAVVKGFDLETAAVKANYPMPKGSFCNDITTAPDGTLYAADTSGGRIMRLRPGADVLDVFFEDKALNGVDGIALSPDGTLFVNNVDTGLLYRLDMGNDGNATGLTEILTPRPLEGPDGMRFGDDGKLYLAENKAGRADVLTITNENASIQELADGFETATAVTKLGDTLWVLEAKFGKMSSQDDLGGFYMYAVDLTGGK